jgi:hypothetical protein
MKTFFYGQPRSLLNVPIFGRVFLALPNAIEGDSEAIYTIGHLVTWSINANGCTGTNIL